MLAALLPEYTPYLPQNSRTVEKGSPKSEVRSPRETRNGPELIEIGEGEQGKTVGLLEDGKTSSGAN